MAAETFKKRQKEAARREKQGKKLARRLQRKIEKAKGETKGQEENPRVAEFASKHGPTIL
jgi:ABC-type Fe3+-hydroxamate transport system substrate-binding protein